LRDVASTRSFFLEYRTPKTIPATSSTPKTIMTASLPRLVPEELPAGAAAGSAGGGVVFAVVLGGKADTLESPVCSGSTGGFSTTPGVPPVSGLAVFSCVEGEGVVDAAPGEGAGAGVEVGDAARVDPSGVDEVRPVVSEATGLELVVPDVVFPDVVDGSAARVEDAADGPAPTIVIRTASGAAPGLSWYTTFTISPARRSFGIRLEETTWNEISVESHLRSTIESGDVETKTAVSSRSGAGLVAGAVAGGD
jgi:hypothetical protein